MKFSNLNIFWAFVLVMAAVFAGGIIANVVRKKYAGSKLCPGCGAKKPDVVEDEVVTTSVDPTNGQPTLMRMRY